MARMNRTLIARTRLLAFVAVAQPAESIMQVGAGS
jgi:hypothetical protein